MSSLTNKQYDRLVDTIGDATKCSREGIFAGKKADASEIVRLITAKPWRRTSVDEASLEDIKKKVTLCMSNDLPLEFALPFGGYKGWRCKDFPHVDWAEVFWLDYLSQFAGRIAEVYQPGVRVTLSYTSGVIEWMNQIPEEFTQTYLKELSSLLIVKSSNEVTFALEDHSIQYGGASNVIALLEERVETGSYPDEVALASAARNLFPGCGNAARIPDVQDTELAARRCAAMMSLEARRAFNKFGPRVQLTHIRGGALSLHIGSTRSSVAQPWVSSGYLCWDASRDEWIPRLANRDSWPQQVHDIDLGESWLSPYTALRTVPVVY